MRTQHTIHRRFTLWQHRTLQRVLWLTIYTLLLSLGIQHPIAAQTPLPQFNLVQNAATCGPHICLTTNVPDQTGAAWLPTKQQVQDGFAADFTWRIVKPGRTGADGFALVLHNAADPFPGLVIGTGRNGMGYSTIPNSLAIEFDTVENPPEDSSEGTLGDPNANHVSVQTRGVLPNSGNTDFSLGFTTQTTPAIPLFADGSVHTTKVFYKPGNPGNIAVFLDNMERPILNAHVNLAELLSLDAGTAWVGFTAATGRQSQAYELHSFTFQPTQPAQQPASLSIDILPGTDPNTWACQEQERDLAVAILTMDKFDATTLTRESIRFGENGARATSYQHQEVNGDGRDDLLVAFRFGDTGFDCQDIPQGQDSVDLTAHVTGAANGVAVGGEGTLRLVR
jgi:hypothetical protein